MGSSSHCDWEGVTCGPVFEVNSLDLNENALSGSFPTDLNSLGSLSSLVVLKNDMGGTIPDDICARAASGTLSIYGDMKNCPYSLDMTTGQISSDCCDAVLPHVPVYLSHFTEAALGDYNCLALVGTEQTLCNYLREQNNHEIFSSGYPTGFEGDVWRWLKERTVLLRMFLNDGGYDWSSSMNWYTYLNHCDWEGVTCSSNAVTEIHLQDHNLIGPYPTDLYSIASLSSLDLSLNSLVGTTPDDICSRSTSNALYLVGDATNCPNEYNEAALEYSEGCCDVVQG